MSETGLAEVPFPQKRNTLDYAFFKKYNYWISTIHGQFSLKLFLNHNTHNMKFQKLNISAYCLTH